MKNARGLLLGIALLALLLDACTCGPAVCQADVPADDQGQGIAGVALGGGSDTGVVPFCSLGKAQLIVIPAPDGPPTTSEGATQLYVEGTDRSRINIDQRYFEPKDTGAYLVCYDDADVICVAPVVEGGKTSTVNFFFGQVISLSGYDAAGTPIPMFFIASAEVIF